MHSARTTIHGTAGRHLSFDDDEYLAYQRSLGVKPQKYSREIVFKLQDRTSPGNSAGGWIVQEDGRPFPFEAHYTYFLAKRAVDTIRNFVQKRRIGTPATLFPA